MPFAIYCKISELKGTIIWLIGLGRSFKSRITRWSYKWTAQQPFGWWWWRQRRGCDEHTTSHSTFLHYPNHQLLIRASLAHTTSTGFHQATTGMLNFMLYNLIYLICKVSPVTKPVIVRSLKRREFLLQGCVLDS